MNLSCVRRCVGCNRGCDVYPERVEEMSLEQIDKFIQQTRDAKDRIHVKKVKIAGGEGLYHSKFKEIYWKLVAAMEEGLFDSLKINMSDHSDCPIPADIPKHPKVRWLHSHPRKKKHLPFFWAPIDMGVEATPCSMPKACGFSLDYRGFTPCSPAIMITRSFGLEHIYKQELPDRAWALDELCKWCVHGMPKQWKEDWFKTHKGLTKTEPTESWKKALAVYEEKEGIQKKVYSLGDRRTNEH